MAGDDTRKPTGRTRARKIANDLRDQIEQGVLAPGQQLPSGPALIARYGTSAQTVQNAIDLLKAEGVVVSRVGAGVYVRAAPQPQRIERRRYVFRDELGYYFDAAGQGLRLVGAPKVDRVAATADVARRLRVEVGSEVVRRFRVLGDLQASLGLQVAVSFLPAWLAEELPIVGEEDTGTGGIYDRIEEWSGAPLQWEETQGAVAATDVEAGLLDGVTHGGPLVRVVRVAFLPDGRPVEVNDTRMDAGRYEIVAVLERHESAVWPVAPAVEPIRFDNK